MAVTTSSGEELVAIPETCKALGDIHPSTLWRLCRKGLIRPVRLGARTFYLRSEIDALLAKLVADRDEQTAAAVLSAGRG